MSERVRIGITMGDPSGVGPALIMKALTQLRFPAELVVIGDAWVLSKLGRLYRFPHSRITGTGSGRLTMNRMIDLHNVPRRNFVFGKIKAAYGKASVEYLQESVRLIKNREIDCLVTCPISKEAIAGAGFSFPGHTEFLSREFKVKNTVMLLLNKEFKIALVTRHLPLKKVSSALSSTLIYNTIRLSAAGLKEYFGIAHPRIMVCALNPHASDGGRIGDEEHKVIVPALRKVRRDLKENISGPLPCDIAIKRASCLRFDALIAMYHDQALIPLKLTGEQTGVNVTLGLPFIRTSPLHGTAFDIASRPEMVDCRSFIEAVTLAYRCARDRRKA